MYHRESQQNQRSRSPWGAKLQNAGLGLERATSCSDLSPIRCDLVSIDRARVEGNVQFRKRTYATQIALDSSCGRGLQIEEDSFALGFRRSPSKKAPSKTLIGEEMSNELEIRRPSPGVIAKLMGLDTMPPRVVPKQYKEMGNFRKASTVRFKEKYVTYEDYSLWMNTNEHQEIKDVFEVQSTKAEKHKNQKVWKGMSKQKFIDEEHLPTDEMEVQDSHTDPLLKFLQEPNSLFTKHLHDLKCDPSSRHANHITILKSSKGTNRETNRACFASTRNSEECIHMQSDIMNSSKKHTTTNASCHYLKEHSCYLPNKLSRSRYVGKAEADNDPTKIVVLKPSLEKAQNIARTVPFENFQFGGKGHRESPRSGIRAKSSRDVAREFTKQVRNTVSSSIQDVLPSKFDRYSMDESSCSSRSGWTSDNFDDCHNSFGASSSCSLESSVNREARKRLSKRWKMIHHFQEAGLGRRRSSTLGEMLALSDKGTTPKNTMEPLTTQEISNNMSPNDSLDRKGSRRRRASLRSSKYCSNKPRFYFDGEEDKLPEREIYVNSEKLRNRIHVEYLAEDRSMNPELSEDAIGDGSEVGDNVSIPKYKEAKFPFLTNEELVKQPTTLTVLPKDGAFSSYHQKDIPIKEASIEHPQNPPPSHCNISDSGSPLSSDEADRPSPVSILEPPSKEGKSGGFKRTTADLHELRMQLQLLKLDSADKFIEELEVFDSSDEESTGDPRYQILPEFRDEEDRDFSYLLDIVIESGVHGSNWSTLFDACYSQECPIGADVFDKLEKKYSLLVSWSRIERKLLFDLVNASLVGIIVSYMDLQPSVKPKRRFGSTRVHEDLVEEVWQTVVAQRKEVSGNQEEKLLDLRWLDIASDVDMIGQEIERMLKDDLLEELVSELI